MLGLGPISLGVLGLGILAAGEVPNFLSGPLPSFMTIRRFAAEESDLHGLRVGEVFAGVMIGLVGIGTALVAGHIFPLLAVVAVAVAYFAGYEWAIRNPIDDAAPINAAGNTNGAAASLRLVTP